MHEGSLKFCMLSPADRFLPIVRVARAVVFAGGTMQPVSHLVQQLLPGVPPSRVVTLSCGHVIPRDNVLALCVASGCVGGPDGQFDFSFKRRDSEVQANNLGMTLLNVVTVVPAGCVCFFPSYGVEDKMWARWTSSGLAAKLAARTTVRAESGKKGSRGCAPTLHLLDE